MPWSRDNYLSSHLKFGTRIPIAKLPARQGCSQRRAAPPKSQNISSYFRLDIPNSVLYMFSRVLGGRKAAVTL